MKPPRPTGQLAVVESVNKLAREFKYRDADTQTPAFQGGGGGGMAHILIVSDSEPDTVQAKADFVVNEVGAAGQLNGIFATLDGGPYSIWMAGRFIVDENVDFPSGSWVRGLGYTEPFIPVAF